MDTGPRMLARRAPTANACPSAIAANSTTNSGHTSAAMRASSGPRPRSGDWYSPGPTAAIVTSTKPPTSSAGSDATSRISQTRAASSSIDRWGASPWTRLIARNSTASPVALSSVALVTTQKRATTGSTTFNGYDGESTTEDAKKARSPSLGTGITARTNGNHPIDAIVAREPGSHSSP